MKKNLYLAPEKDELPVVTAKQWNRAEFRKLRRNWSAIFGLAGLPENDADTVFLYALKVVQAKSVDRAVRPCPQALSHEIVRVLEKWYKPAYRKLPEVLENYLILFPAKPVPLLQ